MEKRKYSVSGRVVDKSDGRGIRGVLVEGWDHDRVHDDLVGSTLTDKEGAFIMRFDESYFMDHYRDNKPDLYFKVLKDGEVIASTEDSIHYNLNEAAYNVTIAVKPKKPGSNKNLFDTMSKGLKHDMDELIKHEDKIVEKLKNTSVAERFTLDPVAVLTEMKIPVSSLLKKRLRQNLELSTFNKPRSFRLPNGQLITPNITIHYTARKGA